MKTLTLYPTYHDSGIRVPQEKLLPEITQNTSPEQFDTFFKNTFPRFNIETHKPYLSNAHHVAKQEAKNNILARHILMIGGNSMAQQPRNSSEASRSPRIIYEYLKTLDDAEFLYECKADLNCLHEFEPFPYGLPNIARNLNFITPLTLVLMKDVNQGSDMVANFLISKGALFLQPSLDTPLGQRIHEAATRVLHFKQLRTAAFLSGAFLHEKPVLNEDGTWGKMQIVKRNSKTNEVIQTPKTLPQDVTKKIYKMSDLNNDSSTKEISITLVDLMRAIREREMSSEWNDLEDKSYEFSFE